jgi:crotonobetainyl-CoA:carnitine CoA-transferase CaiB-like acyl-CoA transferase
MMKGPLNGIKVLEFAQIAAGPFAGSLFADLGADVVKVERPDGGDGMRTWPPAIQGGDGPVESGNFASVNRNKRSITVDVKNPEEMKRFFALVAEADLFIEN